MASHDFAETAARVCAAASPPLYVSLGRDSLEASLYLIILLSEIRARPGRHLIVLGFKAFPDSGHLIVGFGTPRSALILAFLPSFATEQKLKAYTPINPTPLAYSQSPGARLDT